MSLPSLTALGAALGAALAISPTVAATAATPQPAKAISILRIGPATGRVVVKIRCADATAKRSAPLSGQYTLSTPDGRKVASGGFSCSGANDQYAYATVVGSVDEDVPGTSATSKAVAGADRLAVQLREVNASGRFTRLGGTTILPVGGYLLSTDVAGNRPDRARSSGGTDANHAPALFVSATPSSLERCSWKVAPLGGPSGEVTSDPDGNAVTVTWYADGKRIKREPLTTAGGTRFTVLRHTFKKLGVHHVKVVADDGHGASTQQTIKLTCVSSKRGS